MSLHQLFCNNESIALEASGACGASGEGAVKAHAVSDKAQPFLLKIDPADAKHVKALRLNVGEHLAVVDASNDYFEVEIAEIRDGQLWVRVCQHLDAPAEALPVYLVQGLAKGEKMDSVLRAATELGIAGFVPATMERSVVKLDAKKARARHERFETIARSASMQSGRTNLPDVWEPCALSSVTKAFQPADLVLIFWEEAPLDSTVEQLFREVSIEALSQEFARVWVVIGPEGGISAQEIETLKAAVESSGQVHLLSLGPTILRTETAGVVASALVINQLRFRASSSEANA